MNLRTISALDAKDESELAKLKGGTLPMDFSGGKVVSSSRKRAVKKVTRYDAIKNNPPSKTLRDAGGGNTETGEPGIGYETLKLDVLADEQLAMFKRSTLTSTILDNDNREQEVRQTKIVVNYTDITVNMRREDFPSISADVPVRFTDEALQAAWGTFLFDVRVALNVEFIDSILDRKDMAPVNRILELRDGGQYFVRQREESAILEVIQSGKNPEQTSWVVTEGINRAKENIKDSTVAQGKIDIKVDEILSRPALRDAQREATFKILEAEEVEEITEAMWEVMNAEDLPPEEFAAAMTKKMNMEAEAKAREEERQERLAHLVATGGDAKEILELSQGGNMQAALGQGFGTVSTKTYDKEVDIIGLYRLSFEAIQRMLLIHTTAEKQLEIAHNSFAFIKDTMEKFHDEVDICVLGAKLLSDLSNSLVEYRQDFYNIIMDSIQLYAPINETFRPPRVIRRHLSELEKQAADKEWEAQLHADKNNEGQNNDEAQTKIDFEIEQKGGDSKSLVFNLEEYLAEQAELKKLEEERAAAEEAEKERLRLEALALLEVVEEKPKGPFKKVKAPWRGTKGYIGKPVPVEEEHESEFDKYPDEGKKKKRVLKGFKSFNGSRALPVVPGIKFRGLVGPYKKDMAMLQCFATLYKFVCASYGNREKAFHVDMPEEVASIGLVCLGNTSIMEYTMWIIDTIYMDGFLLDPDDDGSVAPSMAVSAEPISSTEGTGDNDNDISHTKRKAKNIDDAISQLENDPDLASESSTIADITVEGGMNMNFESDAKINDDTQGHDDNDFTNRQSSVTFAAESHDNDSPVKAVTDVTSLPQNKTNESKGTGSAGGHSRQMSIQSKDNRASKELSKKSGSSSIGERSHTQAADDDVDPMVGVDIDLASAISMPSLDLDGHNQRLVENIKVNLGNPNKRYDNAFTFDPELADDNDEDLTANLALDPEDQERATRYKERGLRQSHGMIEELGEELYQVRYTRRPRDPVVLFCAMASCHGDLQQREREMGKKWCGIWNDASARYKRLMVIGNGLSGL